MAGRRRSWVVWPALILLLLLISPLGLIMFGMWRASDSWDFTGQGWRYGHSSKAAASTGSASSTLPTGPSNIA